MILGLGLLLSGTTFVVRENGVEVGRYEHDDGSLEIKFVDQTLTKDQSQESVSEMPSPPPPESDEDPTGRLFIKFYAMIVAVSCGAAYLAWLNHQRGDRS